MNKPNKCKNCKWYGKPYWSIINPCDNCSNDYDDSIQIITCWKDPTIDELQQRIYELENVINELDRWLEQMDKYHIVVFYSVVKDKLKELRGEDNESN